jgi:FtsZ-binding cell division protein ZapB
MSKLSNLLGDFARQHPLDKSSWKRFVGALAFSSLTSLSVVYLTHKNYWEITIYRVQTVDFNILSNVLPSKLSTQLLTNDRKGLQSTLDSNYGLFGMILTDCKSDRIDCPQQKITYASKTTVQTTPDGNQKLVPGSGYPGIWAKKFTDIDKPAQLLSGDFLLLRDPIPNNQEWKFESSHAKERISSGLQNPGKIIGRVYLLRSNRPSFISEIQNWLQNPWKVSRSTLVYNAITGTALLTGIIVWLLSELAYCSQKKADRIKLESEKQVGEATKIKLEAEKQIRQATERVLSANKAASEAKANALNIQAAANAIRQSESKTQQEKLDAQDKADKADIKAGEAEAKAEALANKLEFKTQDYQDLYDLIQSEDEELKQERKKLKDDNQDLVQTCKELADKNQELEKTIKKIQDDKTNINNNKYVNRDNSNEIKLPISGKNRSKVVKISSISHHRPKSWDSVKSMLENLTWVEYVRFDKDAFNAPPNGVKIATKGTKDNRHIFWIRLVDKSDNTEMAVSIETTGYTDEHAQESAKILREELRKSI